MARPTFGELAAALAEGAELPAGWTQGPDRVEWSAGGLLRRLRVNRVKHEPKLIVWWVEVLDEPTRDTNDDTALRIIIDYSKRLGVLTERVESGYARPTTIARLDEAMVCDVRLLAPPALAFAADRNELAGILMSPTPTVKGHLIERRVPVQPEWRWPVNPGGLVAALAIARDVEDPNLAAQIVAAMDEHADTVLPAPRDAYTLGWTVRQHIAHYARFMDAWMPVDLSDLYATPSRRR